MLQRKAGHLETLLGLLKMLLDDLQSNRATATEWRRKAAWAIARGQAILAGAADPDEPADLPAPSHVLATLHEDCVRTELASILESERDFGEFRLDSITDAEIHAACLATAATIDLSNEIAVAEHNAARTALRETCHCGD